MTTALSLHHTLHDYDVGSDVVADHELRMICLILDSRWHRSCLCTVTNFLEQNALNIKAGHNKYMESDGTHFVSAEFSWDPDHQSAMPGELAATPAVAQSRLATANYHVTYALSCD